MDLAADDPARLHPGESDLENWAAPDPQTRPDLWPSGLKRGSQGEMTLHGRSLSELLSQAPQAAGRGGQTPIFVLDMPDFRARLKSFRKAFTAAFGEHEVQVHYAGKAFLCVEIARLAAGAGFGLDTACWGDGFGASFGLSTEFDWFARERKIPRAAAPSNRGAPGADYC